MPPLKFDRSALLLSLVILGAISCGDNSPRSAAQDTGSARAIATDSARAISGRSPRAAAADPSDDKLLDTLTKPWNRYTSDELRAMVKLRSRRDVSKRRECDDGKESFECQLTIRPVAGSVKLAYATIPEFGAIVALIENPNSRNEAFLKVKAFNQVYWLVLKDKNARNPRSIMLDLRGPRPDSVAARKLTFCDPRKDRSHERHASETDSQAGFRECQGKLGPVHEHTTPPWFVCSTGCCYADQ